MLLVVFHTEIFSVDRVQSYPFAIPVGRLPWSESILLSQYFRNLPSNLKRLLQLSIAEWNTVVVAPPHRPELRYFSQLFISFSFFHDEATDLTECLELHEALIGKDRCQYCCNCCQYTHNK